MYDLEYLYQLWQAASCTSNHQEDEENHTGNDEEVHLQVHTTKQIDGGREPNLQSLDLKTLIGFRF